MTLDLDKLEKYARECADEAEGVPSDVVLELIAKVRRLRTRRDELLAAIARITNETPYPDEIKGWTEQRAKLIAEVGTLKAQVAELSRKETP